ncbi:MAG: anti-sigma F factor [Firmicutes bacterium]|nr:anti-sigma F factor [Bacillota bacterium]
MEKELKVQMEGILENQGLARAIAAAYVSQFDPTLDELTEVKTAVSEAFSNAALHGYGGEHTEDVKKTVTMEFATVSAGTIMIKVMDKGCGIEDISKAMEPLFTTDTDQNRSGMGFTVMESFTDRLKVDSKPGQGTTVTMIKKLDTYYGF